MGSVIARIVLRYIAAALVAKGFLSDDVGNLLSGDADIAAMVEVAIGTALATGAEVWHYVARRMRWTT